MCQGFSFSLYALVLPEEKAHKSLAHKTLSGHPGHRASWSGTRANRLCSLGSGHSTSIFDPCQPAGRLPVARGLTKGWFSKRVVLADVPLKRKLERGYVCMFPGNETGTRVHSPKSPFYYETALLSTLESPEGSPAKKIYVYLPFSFLSFVGGSSRL